MKKVLAILIAAIMILQAVPFVAAEETEVDYEYIFDNASHGYTERDTYAAGAGAGDKPFTPEGTVSGGKWGYVYDGGVSHSVRAYSAEGGAVDQLAWTFWSESGYTYDPANNVLPATLTLEIVIDKPGTYSPTFSWLAQNHSPFVEIYLIKAPENAAAWKENYNNNLLALKEADRLGIMDPQAENMAADGSVTGTLSSFTVEEPGNYYLIFIPNGGNETFLGYKNNSGAGEWYTYCKLILTSLSLVRAPMDYEYLFTSTSHEQGDGSYMFGGGNSDDPYTPEGTVSGDKWGYVGHSGKSANARPLETTEAAVGTTMWTFVNGDGYIYDPENNVLPATLTLEIVIDEPGTYSPTFSFAAQNHSPVVEIYLIKAPENAAAWKESYNNNLLALSTADRLGIMDPQAKNMAADGSVTGTLSSFTVEEPGSYYLIFIPNGGNESFLGYKTNPNAYAEWRDYCKLRLASLSLLKIEEVDSVKQAIIGETGGNVAATAPATVSADVQVKKMSAVLGGTSSTEVKDVSLNADGTATVVAEAEKEGKSFLYWVKGLQSADEKKIILPDDENGLSATFKPSTGVNYMIAVYGDFNEATAAKFYNANGQYLPDADIDTRPTMAGYGVATGWIPVGEGIFVADYDEPETTYSVTVKHQNGTAAAVEKQVIPGKIYGDKVEVKAPLRYDAGEFDYNAFNYWVKTGEDGSEQIVSFDETYSFFVFEDCTVTAVYNEFEPIAQSLRKIILSDMDDGYIMAEFIGLSNAVEKGILFGGTTLSDSGAFKTAMTTNGSQFAVNNDEEYTEYIGYAILADGSVIYDK